MTVVLLRISLALLALLAVADRRSVAAAPAVIRLEYAVYGHGFHVLNVEADLRLTAAGYSIVLRDHSVGLIGLMMRTNVTSTATGRFVADGVQPLHFESIGFSRGARRSTVLDYVDMNPVVRLLTPSEPNRDPVDIRDARGSIDTLSAMADMVHAVQRNGRCDGSALIFDGLRLTQASARTAGEQTVPPDPRSPYGGAALRCNFTSIETGGFLHDDDEAKMRLPQHGSAWVKPILADAPALPVRVTFQNPKLGVVTMFLKQAEGFPPAERGGASF